MLGQNTDPTGLLWTYNIPVLSSNERKFILEFESATTQALGYMGTDFPQILKILCTNATGYKDATGSPTTCVCTITPSQITQGPGQSGIPQWVVMYSMTGKDVAWEMGNNRTIGFTLVDESNTPIALPISNGLVVTFRILHVSV